VKTGNDRRKSWCASSTRMGRDRKARAREWKQFDDRRIWGHHFLRDGPAGSW